MSNNYEGYNTNEKDFEDYSRFVHIIEDKYNIDKKDIIQLMKCGLFTFRLTNYLETLKIVFRKNDQDYVNLLELADNITDEYIEKNYLTDKENDINGNINENGIIQFPYWKIEGGEK